MKKILLISISLVCGLVFTFLAVSCKKKQEYKKEYKTIRFNKNIKSSQPGSVYIYQTSHDSEKMLSLSALFIINEDQVNDFIHWASKKKPKRTLIDFRNKFSSSTNETTNKKLYAITKSLHLGIKHYKSNFIGNAFIEDIVDEYIQLYSISNHNGILQFSESDSTFKAAFLKQYGLELGNLNGRLFPKILNNKGKTREFANNTTSYHVYYDIFNINAINCSNTKCQVYAKNIGCVGVMYPPKFEKIFPLYPKQPDFPKYRTLVSLVAFISSSSSESDIYYNDEIFNFRDNQFYFNSFPNGVPISQPTPSTNPNPQSP